MPIKIEKPIYRAMDIEQVALSKREAVGEPNEENKF